MASVWEIEEYLFSIAPQYMKEDWDNVGHLCGHSDREVTKVLCALDPFASVIREAEDIGAQLVVSHHPMIFTSTQTVTDKTATGRALLYAIEAGISVICMHTNLDAAPDGVNDCLARALGLSDVAVLEEAGKDAEGRPYGLGRVGTVPEQSLRDFTAFVKDRLNCPGLRYADAGETVHRIAVGGGSCGEFMRHAAEIGCDTFVTGDIRYNGFTDAVEYGINLIDAGHYQTERIVVPYLAEKLREHFRFLEVVESAVKTDAAQWL